MCGQRYARPGFAPDDRDWQVLVDHLQGVAELAASMAEKAIPRDKRLFNLARLPLIQGSACGWWFGMLAKLNVASRSVHEMSLAEKFCTGDKVGDEFALLIVAMN